MSLTNQNLGSVGVAVGPNPNTSSAWCAMPSTTEQAFVQLASGAYVARINHYGAPDDALRELSAWDNKSGSPKQVEQLRLWQKHLQSYFSCDYARRGCASCPKHPWCAQVGVALGRHTRVCMRMHGCYVMGCDAARKVHVASCSDLRCGVAICRFRNGVRCAVQDVDMCEIVDEGRWARFQRDMDERVQDWPTFREDPLDDLDIPDVLEAAAAIVADTATDED